MRRPPTLALLPLVLAAGCGGGGMEDPGPADGGGGLGDAGSPSDARDASHGGGGDVSPGAGITEYLPLVDGNVLGVHQGSQGGFHVYLTLRSHGLAPGTTSEGARLCSLEGDFENPCVTFVVEDADTGDRLDSFAPLRLPLTAAPDAAGAYDLLPPRLVMLAIRSFSDLEGRSFRVRVAVDDAFGRHADAQVVVTAQPAR